MLTLLDRQLVASYLKAYAGSLISLMGLFVVIDLFTNFEEFTQSKSDVNTTMLNIVRFYSFKVVEIFDRLCEAIVLLAAMFTVAWMQKNNEIIPLLSAGVSTRRIVRPVLLGSFLMIGLVVLNQEFMLPQIDAYLLENRGDPKGERDANVKNTFDSQIILHSGGSALKKEMLVKDFMLRFPEKLGNLLIQAREARFYPAGEKHPTAGVWVMQNTVPERLTSWNRTDILEMKSPGVFYFYSSEIDFETITRSKNWARYVPTWELLNKIARIDSAQLASIAVAFHMRLTRPILGMLLVFMGLSIILRDQNRNVFISAGLCIGLCAVFFISGFACQYLGSYGHLPPALAAWLPVLVFGPISFVMFDAVHT